MKCKEINNNILEYLDNTLPAEKRSAMQDHIDSCPACQKLVTEHKKTWELLGSAPSIEPRPGYIERFWENVDSRKPWYEEVFHTIRSSLLPGKLVLGSVVALCLFAATFVSVQQYSTYATTNALLSSMSEKEWEMLKEYEVVSKLDKIQALDSSSKLRS